MAKIPDTKDKIIFDRSFDGHFGRFKTSDSHDLYYLMTTLQVDDLDYLSTAYQALPYELVDFDEMIQRDIDYNRVDNEIVKYLSTGHDRVIFFPPILVTPLIIDDGKPIDQYRNFKDEVTEPTANDYGKYSAVWDQDKFCLELNLQQTSTGSSQILCRSNNKEYNYVNYAATFKYSHKGLKLVIIDGQHRFVTLQRIYNIFKKKEIIRHIELPLCIFFSPDAIVDAPNQESLLRDMRELFVRVNTTARTVSGHFIVLLRDKSLAAISTRAVADNWKKDSSNPAESYLHMLEWNQRENKLANQLNRIIL